MHLGKALLWVLGWAACISSACASIYVTFGVLLRGTITFIEPNLLILYFEGFLGLTSMIFLMGLLRRTFHALVEK